MPRDYFILCICNAENWMLVVTLRTGLQQRQHEKMVTGMVMAPIAGAIQGTCGYNEMPMRCSSLSLTLSHAWSSRHVTWTMKLDCKNHDCLETWSVLFLHAMRIGCPIFTSTGAKFQFHYILAPPAFMPHSCTLVVTLRAGLQQQWLHGKMAGIAGRVTRIKIAMLLEELPPWSTAQIKRRSGSY